MKTMTMCCLPSIAAMQVDGQEDVAVTFESMHLLDFLKADLVAMNELCERPEMFER